MAHLVIAAVTLLASSHFCRGDVTLGLNFAELGGGSQNSWPFSDVFRHAGQFNAVRRGASGWLWDRNDRIILDAATGLPAAVNYTAGGTSLNAAQAFVASTLPFTNYGPSQTVPTYLPGTHVLLWREWAALGGGEARVPNPVSLRAQRATRRSSCGATRT